jgi:heme/copper-type cytochrome/quinol oxidase subunit 2
MTQGREWCIIIIFITIIIIIIIIIVIIIIMSVVITIMATESQLGLPRSRQQASPVLILTLLPAKLRVVRVVHCSSCGGHSLKRFPCSSSTCGPHTVHLTHSLGQTSSRPSRTPKRTGRTHPTVAN